MKVLITGTAGFIGFHLAKLLLKDGFRVHGYDSINDAINPGAGTVEFQTSKYNSLIENEGTDELESIERLSFKDQDLFLINGEYKPIYYQGEVVEKTY